MTIRPRTSSYTIASILVTGALAATAAWAQQSTKEPVQVSGAELQAWLSNGFVYAAEDHTNGSVFFVVGEANDRALFYSHPSMGMNTVKGAQRVVGDTLCAKWPGIRSEERCRDGIDRRQQSNTGQEDGTRASTRTSRSRTPYGRHLESPMRLPVFRTAPHGLARPQDSTHDPRVRSHYSSHLAYGRAEERIQRFFAESRPPVRLRQALSRPARAPSARSLVFAPGVHDLVSHAPGHSFGFERST